MRIYSTATFIVLLGFGILTSRDAPRLSTNQPTPLIGVWQRINIAVFLLWVIVLAIAAAPARAPDAAARAVAPAPTGVKRTLRPTSRAAAGDLYRLRMLGDSAMLNADNFLGSSTATFEYEPLP